MFAEPSHVVGSGAGKWGEGPSKSRVSLAVTASPPRALRISDWVVLNCSFSRPDRPASVHWFRGQGRIPVPKSPQHYFAESFLFLPEVSRLDSGPWGCVLTYADGFNVSITYNLTVLGN